MPHISRAHNAMRGEREKTSASNPTTSGTINRGKGLLLAATTAAASVAKAAADVSCDSGYWRTHPTSIRLPGMHVWFDNDEDIGCAGFRWENGVKIPIVYELNGFLNDTLIRQLADACRSYAPKVVRNDWPQVDQGILAEGCLSRVVGIDDGSKALQCITSAFQALANACNTTMVPSPAYETPCPPSPGTSPAWPSPSPLLSPSPSLLASPPPSPLLSPSPSPMAPAPGAPECSDRFVIGLLAGLSAMLGLFFAVLLAKWTIQRCAARSHCPDRGAAGAVLGAASGSASSTSISAREHCVEQSPV